MATNLDLDDKLVEEAKRLGKHRSKRAAVNEALAEYVASRKRRKILDLFGMLEWDPKYDYKAERRRRG
ncbi:MAG: type II toxin-antitoxin system VapB family antitoxin [Gemmatimonadetes bacterium]|nr:type II toxin-antitoxin system VapB family antitoxin [Gemmatimonadota bacterium]MCH7775819.1 type II toxin-antitoxin system VapB family antitoxin [Gemmatimonadota bacterium]MCH8146297.1 type II toxin-antitoxin system VapB family antitoxin [Gemmatimonadota bacterium]MCH8935795.1 type II toxin-antitoxin system VapB family antitoxin [Gemmatimonadota bacterium]